MATAGLGPRARVAPWLLAPGVPLYRATADFWRASSEALPAVAPEMSLMVLLGKPWACAEGATKLAAQAKAARGRARVDNASRMGLGFMVRVLRVD
ncbi:MAG: hypothetical protein EBV35_04985 [Betaproteobacteria bacterium]|nr:hypothetical protein [Betaproteobacteria bacterium]